jgi:hypothetical protein
MSLSIPGSDRIGAARHVDCAILNVRPERVCR